MANDPSIPEHYNDGVTLEEEVSLALKKPKMYQVVLLNDDYTPMEFVVELIEKFFRKNRELSLIHI